MGRRRRAPAGEEEAQALPYIFFLNGRLSQPREADRGRRFRDVAGTSTDPGGIIRYPIALPVAFILLSFGCRDDGVSPPDPDPVNPDLVKPLMVHVLDVDRGDANLIVNGDSRVIIDGGPYPQRFGEYIDDFELNRRRIDAVVLSHTHADHSSGLIELFLEEREIEIGFFFDNMSLQSPTAATDILRDSARARADRGELIYRDASNPCGDGWPICTLKLDGQARLHIMRPYTGDENIDNGSIPVKLVGPDSASFTMWLAGDARRSAIDWFGSAANYHANPGMRVNVLKGQEHGDCRALPQRLLDLTQPEWVTFSLDSDNSNGRIHGQAKALLLENATPWYRTDRNGTITFTTLGTPGGGYSVTPQAGPANQDGLADAVAEPPRCS